MAGSGLCFEYGGCRADFPAELERRMVAVENAVAQQELSGLTVSTETVDDLYRAARGEITSEEVIANIHSRLKMNCSKSADGRTECTAT